MGDGRRRVHPPGNAFTARNSVTCFTMLTSSLWQRHSARRTSFDVLSFSTEGFILLFIECHCVFLRLVKTRFTWRSRSNLTLSLVRPTLVVGIKRIDFTKKPDNGWPRENSRAMLSATCRGKAMSEKAKIETPRSKCTSLNHALCCHRKKKNRLLRELHRS